MQRIARSSPACAVIALTLIVGCGIDHGSSGSILDAHAANTACMPASLGQGHLGATEAITAPANESITLVGIVPRQVTNLDVASVHVILDPLNGEDPGWDAWSRESHFVPHSHRPPVTIPAGHEFFVLYELRIRDRTRPAHLMGTTLQFTDAAGTHTQTTDTVLDVMSHC